MAVVAISKPELIGLLLYVPGSSGKQYEEIRGKTRLMKLVFLLSKEVEGRKPVIESGTFRPYKFGPFDSDVYDALEALKQLQLVEEKSPTDRQQIFDEEVGEAYDVDTVYRLTEVGKQRLARLAESVSPETIKRISHVKTVFGTMPLIELLHYVYQRYPEYAKLSEITL